MLIWVGEALLLVVNQSLASFQSRQAHHRSEPTKPRFRTPNSALSSLHIGLQLFALSATHQLKLWGDSQWRLSPESVSFIDLAEAVPVEFDGSLLLKQFRLISEASCRA